MARAPEYHSQAGQRATSFVWNDIVVLCDDGRADARDYAGLLTVARELELRFSSGFGVLIVVPHNAVPPPEPVRRAINDTLVQVERSIRCMCWLIEGSGFQAAMAHAVLTGMRIVRHSPYARHVSTDLTHALTWMLSLLDNGTPRLGEVAIATEYVTSRLAAIRPSTAY